jgi:hypothetical protein
MCAKCPCIFWLVTGSTSEASTFSWAAAMSLAWVFRGLVACGGGISQRRASGAGAGQLGVFLLRGSTSFGSIATDVAWWYVQRGDLQYPKAVMSAQKSGLTT